jgi:hypothetical protein
MTTTEQASSKRHTSETANQRELASISAHSRLKIASGSRDLSAELFLGLVRGAKGLAPNAVGPGMALRSVGQALQLQQGWVGFPELQPIFSASYAQCIPESHLSAWCLHAN